MEWYYKGTLEPSTSLIWLCPIGYGKFECRIYGSNGWQPLTTEGASADYREVRALLDNKVNIEPGKYMISAELLDKLAGLKTEAELDEIINTAALAFDTHTRDVNNPHKVSKSQLGLGNVDNTSDAQKPVSQAIQTALNKKVDCTTKINDYSLTGDVTITKGDVGLSHVDNTSDINKPISTAQQAALDAKLDKASLMPIATQSEAESNTENTRYMTSLRTFQQWTRNINYSLNNSLNTISKTILGAINELFANKVDKTTVKQIVGTSITDIMSQKALTDILVTKADHGYSSNPKSLKQVEDLKENLSNKQNSLATDGTGTKFPTVDAVNAGFGLKANKEQEAWITPTLTNGVTEETPIRYMKDTLGFVHLKGSGLNAVPGKSVFLLPAGYRPSSDIHVAGTTNNSFIRITILMIGGVYPDSAVNSGKISFDGITFKAET